MPYITQEARKDCQLINSGNLNFTLTQIVNQYLQINGRRYQTMNDIVGALEGCKAEFQRRIVNPYEDEKLQENGDVYHD